MSDIKHDHKTKFQIERIAFFSDAVIAIAVTLLIIEIKAPHIESGTSFADQLGQLQHLLPEFISFIISFAIIISQWIKHHELFGKVINYDKRLISLNSYFLFTIAIIPFSTSYFAHNTSLEFKLPIVVYGASLFILSLLNYLIFRHITNPKYQLFDNSLSHAQLKWVGYDYLLFPIAILVSLLAGSIRYEYGFACYILVLMVGSYISKKRKSSL